MKNNALRKYLTRVSVYTVSFILFIVLMDNVFNGILLDILYNNLPHDLFLLINDNRTFTAFFCYVSGLVIISVVYVFKLSIYLNIASKSISEEEPKIFKGKCPDELKTFSQKLKDFKFELKENERARALAEQQKNDLIVYLAHDLKTPLTSVIGYLSLLEEAKDLPVEQRAKYVGIALDKAYRLEQLINEFFDITRLNLQTIETQRSRVNLTVLLVQILNEFYPMLEEKKLTVIQSIDNDLILYADADKLARVFDNLFRNAVNYSYNNTNILCSAKRQNGYITVTIKNKGDDIPKEKLCRIFDKFYRADPSRKSSTGASGLGLAISKQIVELHNGRISADCNDGITEITVVLPV
ncbi:MAG: HAMP domain-containing histidine kinase [Ruminococcaceae bacterium]|nr:HAMP domain-containing histidine kinase [Oscillospiraceae bacterium]